MEGPRSAFLVIDVSPTIKEVKRVLDRATPTQEKMTKANEAAATFLFGWVMRNFESSGGQLRDGLWKPLSPKYLKWKTGKGWSSKPLIRTGNLRQSFSMYWGHNYAGVGARASFGVDYAVVHEYGSATVPQRRMLPRVEEVQVRLKAIYRGMLTGQWEGP